MCNPVSVIYLMKWYCASIVISHFQFGYLLGIMCRNDDHHISRTPKDVAVWQNFRVVFAL
ncbi:hypothetical protein TSA66_19340 [Noviherbaspirillum autotrophicum]|uniref:Uncharacterized protein n=1 Tax=Noviherbaspirillum autotrophicum TaxID=709839 RepID=A0A0C1YPJ0_9BURK|nr:hypothetical protein TSA66_19340 [Noviherbaspirillum autotrophicum]